MTKIKTTIICVSIVMLFATPKNAAADAENIEPSFNQTLTAKTVSSKSLDVALNQHGLDHIGHGLLFLSLLGFLALRKR
ncbi:MAG: hypothetical protein K6L76_08535 [Agarilytica sp.]